MSEDVIITEGMRVKPKDENVFGNVVKLNTDGETCTVAWEDGWTGRTYIANLVPVDE